MKHRAELVAGGALASAAFLVIALLTWGLSQQSNRYVRDATARSHQYARSAERQLADSCMLASGTERSTCVEKVKQEAREYQRKEQDLAAQKTVAWWTSIAGVAAVFAAALSLLGVFLIWRTLHHTRVAAQATQRMAFDTPLAIRASVEANVAMRDANTIAENAQRAWMRLRAEPKLIRRFVTGGLYIRVNFFADNVGQSPATHFMPRNEIIFLGKNGAGEIAPRIRERIEAWKKAYEMRRNSTVLPNDFAELPLWSSYSDDEIQWVERLGTKMAYAVMLAAAFYRTVQNPALVQLTWRAWYLSTRDEDFQVVSWIPEPKVALGPDDLFADICQSNIQEEYEAGDN